MLCCSDCGRLRLHGESRTVREVPMPASAQIVAAGVFPYIRLGIWKHRPGQAFAAKSFRIPIAASVAEQQEVSRIGVQL